MKSSEIRRGLLALFLFLLLVARPALGVPSDTHRETVLDWNSTLQAVADADQELQSALRQEQSYRETYRSSFSSFYPGMRAYAQTAGQDYQPIKNFDGEGVYEIHQDTYGLEAKLNLFRGFGSVAHANAAYAAWESVQANRQTIETDIVSDVRQSYGQILVLQKQIGFLKRTSARLKLFAELLNVKYKNGTEAKWSVEQARVDAESLDLEVERREAMIQAQKEALAVRMGTAPDFTVKPFVYPSLQEILKRSPDSHPRLRKTRSTLEQVESEKKEIDSAFWPKIDVSYKFEKIRPERSVWTDNHGWLVSASWDLFSGFSTVFDTRAQLEKKRALELDLHRQSENLLNEQARYKRAYEISSRLLKQKEAQLIVARTRLDIVESQFRTGRRSFSEWEQAEDYLSNTERDAIQTESDLIDDLSHLENALGIGLPNRRPGES